MKVGDMVEAAYLRSGQQGLFHVGVVIDIEEVTDLFSEKYAITETNTYVRILSKGTLMTFDLEEDNVRVIYEKQTE